MSATKLKPSYEQQAFDLGLPKDEIEGHPDASEIDAAHERIASSEELFEPEALNKAEHALAQRAEDVLTGICSKEEAEAFRAELENYSSELGLALARMIDVMSQNGVALGAHEMRLAVYELVSASQHDVVADAAFQHGEESIVERMRERMTRTAIGRTAGRAAVAGSKGVAVFGVGATFTAAMGATGGAAAILGAPYAKKAVRGVSKAAFGLVEKEAKGAFSYDGETMKAICEEVALIEDPEERQRRRYELLTLAPLETFNNDLMRLVFIEGDFSSAEATSEMIQHLKDVSSNHLLSFYELRQTREEKAKEAGEKITRDSAADIAGDLVDDFVTDAPGVSDAASEAFKDG